MPTQVETFEIEETTGCTEKEVEAIEEEALDLIEQLGLTGQKSLVAGTDLADDTPVERIPYPKMKADEERVYETLYSSKVDVEAYDGGIMPVRVMQAAAHAKGLFDKVEVWHAPHKDPDPILVGRKGQYSWNRECFMIARWGDALEAYEVLAEKAKAVLTESWKAVSATAMAKLQAFSDTLDSQVSIHLSGGDVDMPKIEFK